MNAKNEFENRYKEVQHLLDSGQIPEAQANIQEFLKNNPNDPEAFYLLAVSYFRAGNYSEAEAGFKTAISLNSRNFRAFHGLGLSLEKMDRNTEAKNAFRSAASINPNFQPTLKKLQEYSFSKTNGSITDINHNYNDSNVIDKGALPRADLSLLNTTGRKVLGIIIKIILIVSFLFVQIMFFGSLSYLIREGGEESKNFSILFGILSIVVGIILSSFSKRNNIVRVRGIARNVSYRQERKDSWLSRTPVGFHVLSFQLETTDGNKHRFPEIPVEQSGKILRGTLSPNTEVVVEGRPTRLNYFKARIINKLDTGEKITMERLYGFSVCWIWILIIIGLIGGIIIGRMG